ncbi:MAG: hypothetical protein GY754_47195 [bacterium]|nr:hypothetical protein [bacterium]
MKYLRVNNIVILVCIFSILFALFPSAGKGQQDRRQTVAVLQFNANNASKFAAEAVSEFIGIEIANKKDLVVIERSRMNIILKEQGFQQSGCTDSDCAVKIGQILSAQKILIGSISRLGVRFTISGKVVDVSTGSVDFAESEECYKEDDIEPASRVLAIKLLNHITGKNYPLPEKEDEENSGNGNRRFGIGIGYRFGTTSGVRAPVIRKTGDMTIDLEGEAANLRFHSLVVTPSFQLTSLFTLKSNLYYTMVSTISISGGRVDVRDLNMAASGEYLGYHNEGYFGEGYFQEDKEGYGANLLLQFNYNWEGISPFIAAGPGVYRFSLSDRFGGSSVELVTMNGGGTAIDETFTRDVYYLYKDSATTSYFVDIQVGVTFYFSHTSEFYILGGINIPVYASAIDNFTIDKKVYNSTGTSDTSGYASFDDSKVSVSSFDGNFPLTWFLEAGITFRLF